MQGCESERLILRNWKLSDSADLFEYAQSDQVGPKAGWPVHKSENDSLEIIKMFIHDDEVLAIELKSEQKVIGAVGLHKRCPDKSKSHLVQREIGYVLNPDYWGKGYMPEAVSAAVQLGFESMNLDLIWCAHFEENSKSRRVNQKSLFTYQFRKRHTVPLLNNKEVISWYYSISKEDYEKRQSRSFLIREITADDQDFLFEMLYQSIYVDPQLPPPDRKIIKDPHISKYVEDWGKEGDYGYIATDKLSGKSLGVVWLRYFDDSNKGYGYVDSTMPELGMAVVSESRGKGVGTALFESILNYARADIKGISLSVDPQNRARRLYENYGFKTCGVSGTSITMKLEFKSNIKEVKDGRI